MTSQLTPVEYHNAIREASIPELVILSHRLAPLGTISMLAEVADMLAMTRQEVRQIESKLYRRHHLFPEAKISADYLRELKAPQT
jgi:DNA-directed RNA polymerase sigma subunit (sigma70/sigma32)